MLNKMNNNILTNSATIDYSLNRNDNNNNNFNLNSSLNDYHLNQTAKYNAYYIQHGNDNINTNPIIYTNNINSNVSSTGYYQNPSITQEKMSNNLKFNSGFFNKIGTENVRVSEKRIYNYSNMGSFTHNNLNAGDTKSTINLNEISNKNNKLENSDIMQNNYNFPEKKIQKINYDKSYYQG